jgi:hypothetical protein
MRRAVYELIPQFATRVQRASFSFGDELPSQRLVDELRERRAIARRQASSKGSLERKEPFRRSPLSGLGAALAI